LAGDAVAEDPIRDPPRALISGSRPVIWLLVAPLVVGLAIFAIYPFIDIVALSFSKSSLGRPFQKWPIVANYVALARDETFRETLVRTAVFAIPVPLVEMALGFSIALLLHTHLRRAGWIRGVILLPLMTPPMMVASAWKLILAPSGGLLDGVLVRAGVINQPISFLGTMPWAFLSVAVADIWQWTPFVAILSYAALQGLSELLRVVIAFKLFDLVYGLTFGGPGFDTTVAAFQVWRAALTQFDIGLGAAQTIIFAILVSVVTLPLTWLHRVSEARAG
jgi:multiple sugar transport system permease protein